MYIDARDAIHEAAGIEVRPGRVRADWAYARATLPEHNLIFWDLGAEGTDYLEMARRAALEPKTFIYSQQAEHTRYWSRGRPR